MGAPHVPHVDSDRSVDKIETDRLKRAYSRTLCGCVTTIPLWWYYGFAMPVVLRSEDSYFEAEDSDDGDGADSAAAGRERMRARALAALAT